MNFRASTRNAAAVLLVTEDPSSSVITCLCLETFTTFAVNAGPLEPAHRSASVALQFALPVEGASKVAAAAAEVRSVIEPGSLSILKRLPELTFAKTASSIAKPSDERGEKIASI